MTRWAVSRRSVLLWAILGVSSWPLGRAFPSVSLNKMRQSRESFVPNLAATDENDARDNNKAAAASNNIDKRLTKPLINVRAESILFSEKPATAADNNALRIWKLAKQTLPPIVTGSARASDTADDNPLAGIYNVVLVRLPTIVAGVVYTKNLLQGHELVVDFGDGPFSVNPLIVYGVLYVILR